MSLGLQLRAIALGVWVQFQQIGGYWAVGLIAGSLINVYLSDKIVARVSIFRRPGFHLFSACIASALGIASPLCMYGTVPLIASLGRKKVPDYLLVTFMISSILLNPNLLIMSFALGSLVAFIRLGLCFVGGVLAGVLAYAFLRKAAVFRLEQFATMKKQKRGFAADLLRAVQVTLPYLLVGILLTAVYDLYFPRHWMDSMFGGNQAMSTLFAMSLSIPLYTCGGGSIPLLMAWMREGMSPGNAITFMLAGPATKFTNLGAVKSILGTRNFFLYMGFCLGYAWFAGMIVDAVLR